VPTLLRLRIMSRDFSLQATVNPNSRYSLTHILHQQLAAPGARCELNDRALDPTIGNQPPNC
jgi:hypothetical protein